MFLSRSESPGTPKRRSSTSNVQPRRGSSYCSPRNYDTPHSPSDKTRSFSRQWDSPRGSLTGTLPRDSPRGSIVSSGTLPRSQSPSAPFTGAIGSQSPSATRRMMGRTHPPPPAKISKSNGPSPLLKDGLENSLSRHRTAFDTVASGGAAEQVLISS